MRKYNVKAVENVLKNRSVSFGDIARALDIDENDVRRYICKHERIDYSDMLQIDAALSIINKVDLRRPPEDELTGLLRLSDSAVAFYNELLQVFDNTLKRVTEQEALRREEQAVDDICFVIGFSNPDITTIRYDPDMDYIKGYSVEEFKKRILERVRLD